MRAIPQAVKVFDVSNSHPYQKIAEVASICYQKDTKKTPKEFVSMLLKRGHFSPLRFVQLTLDITTSRSTSMQLLRHTTGFDYMQESQRYVKYDEENFEYVVPPEANDQARTCIKLNAEESLFSYRLMLKNGNAPQTARAVLSNYTATNIIVQANLEAWRNFLKQRLAKGVQPEMVVLAEKILKECYDYCPLVFDEFYTSRGRIPSEFDQDDLDKMFGDF